MFTFCVDPPSGSIACSLERGAMTSGSTDALALSPTRAIVFPYASPPVASAGTSLSALLFINAVMIAAAVTIAAPTAIAAHGLARTVLRVVLNATIITPNSMS